MPTQRPTTEVGPARSSWFAPLLILGDVLLVAIVAAAPSPVKISIDPTHRIDHVQHCDLTPDGVTFRSNTGTALFVPANGTQPRSSPLPSETPMRDDFAVDGHTRCATVDTVITHDHATSVYRNGNLVARTEDTGGRWLRYVISRDERSVTLVADGRMHDHSTVLYDDGATVHLLDAHGNHLRLDNRSLEPHNPRISAVERLVGSQGTTGLLAVFGASALAHVLVLWVEQRKRERRIALPLARVVLAGAAIILSIAAWMVWNAVGLT